MQKLKSDLNLVELLEKAKGLKYWKDGSGVLMSITQSGGLTHSSLFQSAIDEITNLRQQSAKHLMINNLPANCQSVPKHTDTTLGGRLERWHLPLQTSIGAYFWDVINGEFHMDYGYWHGPVEYWNLHTIYNRSTTTDRIHLIVDLEGIING